MGGAGRWLFPAAGAALVAQAPVGGDVSHASGHKLTAYLGACKGVPPGVHAHVRPERLCGGGYIAAAWFATLVSAQRPVVRCEVPFEAVLLKAGKAAVEVGALERPEVRVHPCHVRVHLELRGCAEVAVLEEAHTGLLPSVAEHVDLDVREAVALLPAVWPLAHVAPGGLLVTNVLRHFWREP